MTCGLTFRLGRTRLVDGRSSASGTLLRIRSLADYTINTLGSSFRKRQLVAAMEEAQVTRLICVTGFGAGDSRGRGGCLYNVAFHLLLGRVYDDKDVQERIVRREEARRVAADFQSAHTSLESATTSRPSATPLICLSA